MGNLEVRDLDFLDFSPPPRKVPFFMGRSAAKKSVDRLLLQAKVDEPDQIKYAKYVEACTNVTFHDDQKGLSLAKIFDMKKALSPGMRL
jgi:hypothetical protein